MQLTSTLDALIAGGQVPPMLVVFVNSSGGPYTDTECANSFDGREWYDRFFAGTVVSYVDAHYRTIGTPQSRAILGFSQGGYCSAALLSHHPDVFRSSIVLSGYFVSGIESGTTPTAWRPFNNDPAIIAATSPMTVVPALPADVRRQLFFVLCADPTNPFYGTQLAQFTHVLDGAGVPMAVFPTPLGHTWAAARTFLPSMLQLVAQRMASQGVFGGG
jgi:enterochelin esterase-like enzyme